MFLFNRCNQVGMTILYLLLLSFYSLSSQAQTALTTDFYQVVLKLTPETSTETMPTSSAQQLNRYLKEGMSKLLVRLTGSRQVLKDAATQPLLKDPKKWLQRYTFQPRKEEGVVVGQNLVLVFDRQRILQYFQQAGLVIWPYHRRPHLLALGTYEVEGLKVPLDQRGIESHLNLDFRPVAEALGLPVDVPEELTPLLPDENIEGTTDETTSKVSVDISPLMWQSLPEFESKLSLLQTLLSNKAEEGVILFKLRSLGEGYQLTYELYDKQFQQLPEHSLHEIVLPKTIQSQNLEKLYQQMMSEVVEYFSEPYRAQASVLGEVILKVQPDASKKTAWQTEQLFQTEKILAGLKPTLHDVKLTTLTSYEAQFEITYQGAFEEMIKLLTQRVPLYLIQADALTGVLQMQLAPIQNMVPSPSVDTPVQQSIEQQLKLEFQQAVQKME